MNSQDEALKKIEELATRVASEQGVRLYDVELVTEAGQRVLRIYIDKDGGIGIDECANVSRGLNEVLDGDDPIVDGAYNLEVSTPGLERNLKKPWHYQAVQGQKIWIKLSRPLETFGVTTPMKLAKQLSLVLKAASETELTFEIDQVEVKLPISAVEKAKLVFEMKDNKKR